MQDGYPTYYVAEDYQALCVAWDPVTRLLKRNTSDIYPLPGETVELTSTTFQFSFGSVISNVDVGDYITVSMRVPRRVPAAASAADACQPAGCMPPCDA